MLVSPSRSSAPSRSAVTGRQLIRERLEPLVTRFATRSPTASILLAAVPEATQFGVAVLKTGRWRLVEKPKDPPSNLGLVGVYMFDATVVTRRSRPSAVGRGELEITDAIPWLIARATSYGPRHRGLVEGHRQLEDMPGGQPDHPGHPDDPGPTGR